MTAVLDWLVAGLLVSGGAFTLIAALGVIRLPDVLIRMHASTKAGTLGVGLIFVAAAVHFADMVSVSLALLTVLFILITVPVAAHAIARATYRTGVPCAEMRIDELAEQEPRRRAGTGTEAR